MNSKDFCELGEELQEISETSEVTDHDTNEIKPVELLEDRYFIKRPTGNISGGIMEFVGFSMAVFLVVIWIGFCALDIAFQGVSLLLIPMIVVALMIGLFSFMGVKGRIIRKRVKRFKKYKYQLNGREFCDISELAETVEKSEAFVAEDLKQMIEKKWFLQGHVDDDEKHLILTDKMYEQYILAMSSLKGFQVKDDPRKEEMESQKNSEEESDIDCKE